MHEYEDIRKINSTLERLKGRLEAVEECTLGNFTKLKELEKKPCMSWNFAYDTEQNTRKIKKLEEQYTAFDKPHPGEFYEIPKEEQEAPRGYKVIEGIGRVKEAESTAVYMNLRISEEREKLIAEFIDEWDVTYRFILDECHSDRDATGCLIRITEFVLSIKKKWERKRDES